MEKFMKVATPAIAVLALAGVIYLIVDGQAKKTAEKEASTVAAEAAAAAAAVTPTEAA